MNDIRLFSINHLFKISVYFCSRNTKISGSLFSSFYDDIAESDQFNVLDLFQRRKVFAIGDTAAANQTDLQLLH